jgi:tetratricopeptide (TPR) repeat protein
MGRRIRAILLELVGTGDPLPDILVLPECSVPLEALHVLKEFAVSHGLVVVAGTHTPRVDDATIYRRLGVRQNVEKLFAPKPPQVLPLLTRTASKLLPKQHRAPLEQTDLQCEGPGGPTTQIAVEKIKIGDREVRVALAICADALRQASAPIDAEVVIVVACQPDPSVFIPHLSHLRGNEVPAFLANGAFGGSGVFANADSRTDQWFMGKPFRGQLPAGDSYVEYRLNLSKPAPQRATVSPSRPVEVVRLMPILCADDRGGVIDVAARAAFEAKDAAKLEACVQELERHAPFSSLASARWRHLIGRLQVRNVDQAVTQALAGTLVVPGPSLEGLEVQLAEECASRLADILARSGSQHLPKEAFGACAQAEQALRAKAGSGASESVGAVHYARSILDRAQETEILTSFLNEGSEAMVVIGLPQVGKSAVIAKAVHDAGVNALPLWCREGVSADVLYEVLMTSGRQVPVGGRPRREFDPDGLALALKPFDVVWLRDAQHLLLDRRWATPEIAGFMSALVAVAKRGEVRIIVESPAFFPELVRNDITVRTLVVHGLPDSYATTLLKRELRTHMGKGELIAKEMADKLLKAVGKHPRLLSVCAEACAKSSAELVVEQLERGVGEVADLMAKLVRDLKLSTTEQSTLRCLAETRLPVPAAILADAVPIEAAPALDHSSLVERDEQGHVSLAPILRSAALKFPAERELLTLYHKRVSAHFAEAKATEHARALTGVSGGQALVLAIEANYHAKRIGIKEPCSVTGLLDPVAALARESLDAKDFRRTCDLLRGVVEGHPDGPWGVAKLRSDVVAVYARALARNAEFKLARECVSALVSLSVSNASHYLEVAKAAIGAGQLDVARLCLADARQHIPTSSDLPLVEGQVCERSGDLRAAIERYGYASKMPRRSPWTEFYLARALLSADDLEEALLCIGEGLERAVDAHGRINRRLENALRELELQTLVLAGKLDEARRLAETLKGWDELAPEAMLTIAFVTAMGSRASGASAITTFEDLVAKAGTPQERDREFRGRVALFRGKLFSALGDSVGAEAAFRDASQSQPNHRHVLLCHQRELGKLLERRQDDHGARVRLRDVEAGLRRLNIAGATVHG